MIFLKKFLCVEVEEWELLVLKHTHLLANLFQSSVSNKRLPRLFKALPGGVRQGLGERG